MSSHIYKYLIVWIVCSLLIIQTKKPSGKRQQIVWRLECELGIISDSDCPIDGGWSAWSPWSACQGPCDDVGHRHRTRECINPPPSQDGTPCGGPEEETDICYLTNCTVNDFRELVKGDSARMEALNQLEAVPALMERCLQMECPFEAIEAALAFDNTWQLNSESLWNSLQCVKRNLGCPVIGEWGTWGSWSSCGARCGRGLKWRLRRCDTPAPSDARLACSGSPLIADVCVGDQCAITSKDSGGSWGEWSSWSSCSEKCGAGVRRRRRVCHETDTLPASGTWGTHCRGQHDQLEVCENGFCSLDGGWSGWGSWGPCSQTCGSGRRARTRTCTRPIPHGKGSTCVGPKTEVGSCHFHPCETFSHTVAIFHGESSLHYNLENKRATLYQFYMRFMPLSPHGTLVRREAGQNSFVRLSLQKWHVCLDACGSSRSCCLPRTCSHTSFEPATWHTALLAVTGEGAVLRLNEAVVPLKIAWPCDPDLPDDKMRIFVGERFHGQIQELILNFIPLNMIISRNRRSRKSDFHPIAASNIAYEKANTEEAYMHINNDQYLRLPCFLDQQSWRLELTLKTKKEAGTILFLRTERSTNWLHLYLQNMRLKMKLALGTFRTESSSTSDCAPEQWLNVTISKKQDTNAIEACINAGERLHVLFEEVARKRRDSIKTTTPLTKSVNTSTTSSKPMVKFENVIVQTKDLGLSLCSDEFFIGGIPNNFKSHLKEEVVPFNGVIASIRENGVLLDLHGYNMERYKEDKIQVSSRSASVSGSYHETAWGKSNRLNLTCLHARTSRSPHDASWLYLDTAIDITALKEKTARSVNDGRVLRLVATADHDLRGFYTCRAHSNRRTQNIVTYGVLGKIQYKLSGPDTTTAIAVITTLVLVISTLIWLAIECFHDIRNGYGFFRDAHLSPKEEAEAVCEYIDLNINLLSSKSDAKVAKARARKRARQLVSRSNFAAQEPQGLMQESLHPEQSDTLSEPEGLPALPEVKSSKPEPLQNVYSMYRVEPCYMSSPRPDSTSTPKLRATSTSSFELVSPRVLCSRLLMHKRTSSKESFYSKKSSARGGYTTLRKKKGNLLTIKSSVFVAPTPAQKILQRFQSLKGDDI
ncbi:hypothetical protein SFRURICE_013972 [Spodoptera frugiperda]|uniref:SFRICE_036197 n=1 Tax=Spodoptera frugiperda TaxID=7108 RepID=A0A2H1W3W1_SPOFR|nr:hypothetical protein SFRURICE_013972 [Spodoptera frugiperda]